MRRLITSAISVFVLLIMAHPALAADWSAPFRANIVEATLPLLPPALRAKLPTSRAAFVAAAEKSALLTAKGKRDPQEHLEHVRRVLGAPGIPPERLAEELTALTAYYVDATAPNAPRKFYVQVARSGAIAAGSFAGFYTVTDFPGLIALVKDTARPARDRIEAALSGGATATPDAVGDDLQALFDLYANVTADLWITLAQDAGIASDAPPAAGVAMVAAEARLVGGPYQPSGEGDPAALTRAVFEAAVAAGAVTAPNTPPPATHDDDEIVFDEGLSVSGDEAQASADQLAGSDVSVDSQGVDRMAGLDEKTIEALNKLGIDTTGRRPPFKGTRGGVKPGQIVTVGDVSFPIAGVSSVEIGSRAQMPVYMQLPDSALTTAGGSGQLNQKAVAAVIGANVGGIKSCFERRLREVPDLSGRVFVEFTIATDGTTTSVRVLENTTGDSTLADCLSRQVERLRFPPPDGGEVTFVFPFIFEQAYSF